ncbi:type I-E CRISPR-associated endoribonuclease Cas2e [Bifidobacterium aquikefiricola]|uniref:Type I-E CRISPR-associated endoribonuclease Cas2e n=1 Tax=Bifidobacterium aquikefiricola TaxID=3059038 RepID=A0AB39U4Y0_9BIFI
MPLVTITLTKVPPSLRGTLSKWLQEIDTGVFVGNINTKIREQLWKRVLDSIGDGRATISFYQNNEQGYNFATEGFRKEVRDFDGVSIITDLPLERVASHMKSGFSNASKYRKARKFSSGHSAHTERTRRADQSAQDGGQQHSCVVLDIETTGLDPFKDSIIELGAVKIVGKSVERFERLIAIESTIPASIVTLTGITDDMLHSSGVQVKDACSELLSFIGADTVIGWNVRFDIGFIHRICPEWEPAQIVDIMRQIKKEHPTLPSFKLAHVANSYGIPATVHHRALQDCELALEIYKKTKSYKSNFQKRKSPKLLG